MLSGHTPYRPWCEHCVAGQGRTAYHREVEREVGEEVPVIAMDYGFLGAKGVQSEEAEDGTKGVGKILVLKDRRTKAVGVVAIRVKGTGEPYNI